MAQRLSIEECQKALPSEEILNESEVTQIRDDMYTLASTLLEAYDEFRASAPLLDAESPLPMDLIANALRIRFGFDDDDCYGQSITDGAEEEE